MMDENEDLVSAEEASYLRKSTSSVAGEDLGGLLVAKLDDRHGLAQGLDESQVSALEEATKGLAAGLTAALTAVLGDQTTAQSCRPRFGTVDEFRASLPACAERLLKGPEPNRWAVLAVPVPLAEEILDRMLGAGDTIDTTPTQGTTEGGRPEPRKLTSVDERLLDELFSFVSREWAGILHKGAALQVMRASREKRGDTGEPGASGPANLIASFDVEGRAFGGSIMMLCPVGLLIDTGTAAKGRKPREGASGRRLSPDMLAHIRVGLSARLGNVALLSTDLAALRPGVIIPLDTSPDGRVTIVIAGKTWFEGRLARNGDRIAVEIVGPGDGQALREGLGEGT